VLKTVLAAFALATVATALQGAPLVAPGLSEDTLKWAMQVGGPLFVLNVLVLALYRRDFLRLHAQATSQNNALMEVVTNNIAAFKDYAGQHERLARAVEKVEERVS